MTPNTLDALVGAGKKNYALIVKPRQLNYIIQIYIYYYWINQKVSLDFAFHFSRKVSYQRNFLINPM